MKAENTLPYGKYFSRITSERLSKLGCSRYDHCFTSFEFWDIVGNPESLKKLWPEYINGARNVTESGESRWMYNRRLMVELDDWGREALVKQALDRLNIS